MDKIESFKPSKLLTALIITLLIFAILVIYIAHIEANTKHLDDTYKIYPNRSLHLLQLDEKITTGKTTESQTEKYQKLKSFAMSKRVATNTKAACSFTDSCALSCSGGTIDEIIVIINAFNQQGNSCMTEEYISLIIQGTKFTNNTITSGWLQNVTVGVKGLTMASIDVEQLGNSIFSGKPFGSSSNPLRLTLSNTYIKILKKSMFSASSLSALQISFTIMSDGIKIEEDLFEDASSSVNSITLNYCLSSEEALKNLTGRGSILGGLQTLDLSYNLLSKLGKDIFLKAPNLRQIYLVSSGLNVIELGAFDGLSQVIQLHLSNNNLKTLPEGLFNDMGSLIMFYIINNPWNCECSMQWLKDYLSAMNLGNTNKCKVGLNWVDMADVDFCPTNSTTSTTTEIATKQSTSTETSTRSTVESSTSITTITSEQPGKNEFIFEKIKCRNLLMYSFGTEEDDVKILWYESIFKRRKIKYSFSEIKNSDLFVFDISTDLKTKDFLIWTNVDNRSDYGCVFNITSNLVMKLQYEKTYTICISSNDTTDTYALIADDCTAVATPPDWEHRTWISNRHKTAIILCTVLISVINILVACAAVYYLVKYNPEFIKGNKRVLIVKSGSYSPNILVMSKERHVSLCTDNGGYLTPKLKHWLKKSNSFDKRYQELETITDNSSVENTCDADDKNIYEPPPLPPNHPTKRRDSGRPYFYSNM